MLSSSIEDDEVAARELVGDVNVRLLLKLLKLSKKFVYLLSSGDRYWLLFVSDELDELVGFEANKLSIKNADEFSDSFLLKIMI